MRVSLKGFLSVLPLLGGLASVAGDAGSRLADAQWADAVIARFATNYVALMKTVDAGTTDEKPFPRSFVRGQMVYCADWDWCSGFYQGSLWYLYEATGDAQWKAAAARYTEKQSRVRYSNLHHDLGFMFLPSAGHGFRLTGEAKYATWLYDAARTLTTRFRPGMKAIQSWGNWGPGWKEKWNAPVIIDNLLNLELWEWAGRHPADGKLTPERDWLDGVVFLEMAQAHAETSLKVLLRTDGSSYHIADLNPATGEVVRHLNGQGAGYWSRGQGWSVYGWEMLHRWTQDAKYLQAAERAADWVLTEPSTPADRIPYWDYRAAKGPDDPRDSSAAAVIGCGLIRLARTVADQEKAARYRAEALKIAKSLATPTYFATPEEAGGFVLKHYTGAQPAGHEVDASCNYADYYFLELLLEIKRESGWKSPVARSGESENKTEVGK